MRVQFPSVLAQMEQHLQGLAHRAQWERNWVRLVWIYGRRLARSSRAGLFVSWAGWQRRRAAAEALRAQPAVEEWEPEADV